MRKPTIHLNGSSPVRLMEDTLRAVNSIRTAIADVQNAAPHGRDYYTQESGSFTEVTAEHCNRIERLRSVSDELTEIAEYLADFITE